jgi:hypothetical protein
LLRNSSFHCFRWSFGILLGQRAPAAVEMRADVFGAERRQSMKNAKSARPPRQKKRRGHIVAKGIVTYDLTKIAVAEALLVSAIRQFFENAHPVPVYLLASSAREILTTIGDKVGVETILHSLAKKKGSTLKEAVKHAHTFAGFFKHADRDPTATLQFSDDEADTVLAMALPRFWSSNGGHAY